MKILSIQVGLPKEIIYRGKAIFTAIFKSPIEGPVQVRTLSIEGDGQGNLKVHGGVDKAVYAYSFDAYDWWRQNRPGKYDYGAFGENLTVDNLSEKDVHIGDTFQVGEAILQVSEPRFPCSRLVARYDDPSIMKTFNQSERSGIYFRVLKEGLIEAGSEFKLLKRDRTQPTIHQVFIDRISQNK
jgi:MOSC domain-containing protein YiiM